MTVDTIQDKIRLFVKTKRIRVIDFFQDFDRLRSGSITAAQFRRCLDKCLNSLNLSDGEISALVSNYTSNKTGMACYRDFAAEIDRVFVPGKLNLNPEAQKDPSIEYLGTARTVVEAPEDTKENVSNILGRVSDYYKYHGVNIRSCYEDFDRHNNGLVTVTQFARRFPGPADVGDAEIRLIAEYYKDPVKVGMTNYLNFHQDMKQIADTASLDGIVMSQTVDPEAVAIQDQALAGAIKPDLRAIFDKIRVAVHKNGIRTTEFFRDHDKLRSGIVTKNQFVCGLSLGCGLEAHLTDAEIKSIADHYMTSDGRVKYTEFCAIMEHAFNVPNLVKKPTVHPVAPPSGTLTRPLGVLSDQEEQKVIEILSSIGEKTRKRQLLLHPYFKDYDRGRGYTRIVTRSQFARILHFLNLTVSPGDLLLLCDKFAEPVSGDVNYPAFCQAVDQEFSHYTIDAAKPIPSSDYVPPVIPAGIDTSRVDIVDATNRIRHHILTNRIRIIEFFQDFDQLRSGLVSKEIFARGLDLMGLTFLNAAEVCVLQKKYQNGKKADCVNWAQFQHDIETAYNPINLEKDPNKLVEPMMSFVLAKEGSMADNEPLPPAQQDTFDEAMDRMGSRAWQRNVLAKPVFQDFDKHNNGHVTKYQYRQCLSYLGLNADEEEVAAIEQKFSDNIGFDYVRFLAMLMPQEPAELKYPQHLEELKATNASKKPAELNALTSVRAVLEKVKTKVSRERMRLFDFMKDYDKLRTGRVLRINFERAIDLAHLGLKESEVAILTSVFASPAHPDFVDYLLFCDEVESIFTLKHLEKNPKTTPVQFKPAVEWEQNTLAAGNAKIYDDAMARLADHVHKTRMQLFPLFEDYDRVHNGTVSRSQFYRVLTELQMSAIVSELECELICDKFSIRIGEKNDVAYIPFCDRVYEIAHFEPCKP